MQALFGKCCIRMSDPSYQSNHLAVMCPSSGQGWMAAGEKGRVGDIQKQFSCNAPPKF